MWKDLIQVFRGDDLYTQALQDCYSMLDLDLAMYEASIESLRYSDDSSVAVDVYKLDKQINAFERDVRKKVMTHLTISGTGQLTSGLVLVSIVIDIERIGDYAKNICDLAQLHPQRLRGQSIESRLVEVETTVTDLFKKTVTAFRNSDVEMSREVMTTYKGQLSADCETIIRDLITGQVPELSSTDTATIALYVRYLKRIAAHSRNIITSVVNPFHRIGYKEKME